MTPHESHHESLSIVLASDAARRDMITGALAPAAFRRAVDAWIGPDRSRLPSSALLLARIDWEVGFGLPVRPARTESHHALRTVADLMTQVIRATDLLGRIDEDTLGILMPSTPAHQTEAVCRRMRAVVSERTPSQGVPLTVSIGAPARGPLAPPSTDHPRAVRRRRC